MARRTRTHQLYFLCYFLQDSGHGSKSIRKEVKVMFPDEESGTLEEVQKTTRDMRADTPSWLPRVPTNLNYCRKKEDCMLTDPMIWNSYYDNDELDSDPPITDAERIFLKRMIVNSGWDLVPWSEAEILRLKEMMRNNVDTSAIGLMLGRSPLDVILETEELYRQKYERIMAQREQQMLRTGNHNRNHWMGRGFCSPYQAKNRRNPLYP